MLRQAGELGGNKIREHSVHVRLVRILAVDALPSLADDGVFRQRLEVQILSQALCRKGLIQQRVVSYWLVFTAEIELLEEAGSSKQPANR